MRKLMVKTRPTPFLKNGRVAYSASVVHNGTIGADTFFERVSEKCGLAADMARATWNLGIEQMKDELRNGNRVELPQLSAFLSLPGNFASTSPEDRRGVAVADHARDVRGREADDRRAGLRRAE